MFCRSGQRWTCSHRWGAVQFAVRARNDFGCSSGKYSTLWKSSNTGHLLEVTTEQEECVNFWRLKDAGGGEFFCRYAAGDKGGRAWRIGPCSGNRCRQFAPDPSPKKSSML